MRAAEKSLQEAQARAPRIEAKLNESRRVEAQLKAHNRSNNYGDFVEGLVLGRLSGRPTA